MSINRRDFIRQSSLGLGTAMVLPGFSLPPDPANPVKFFMPQWGSKLSYVNFFENVKKDGYDGIEMSLPKDDGERKDAIGKIKASGLAYVAQIHQPKELDLKKHIEEAKGYVKMMAEAEPLFINSHTGKDFFSFAHNQEIIQTLNEYAKSLSVKLIHETHRGRFSFAAHVTLEHLKKSSDLRLTFDVSHWMCVAESLLENQPEEVEMAIQHTDHIHSRVGFAEGPQITDPKAPEWKYALDAHIVLWDRIVERKRKAGEALTITTEFGPAPYMVSQPFTKQPIVSQWDTNVFMKEILSKRYNA